MKQRLSAQHLLLNSKSPVPIIRRRLFGLLILSRAAWCLFFLVLIALTLPLSACNMPGLDDSEDAVDASGLFLQTAPEQVDLFQITSTPLPTRPVYAPGELVDYVAISGDTLPYLAVRFNTTVEEIMEANSFIPQSATTMPPGMPMKIPVYYTPLWGNPYQIIPDSRFINGPAMVSFNSSEFVSRQPGWLNGYTEYAAGATRTGAELVDLVAMRFSVSPTLLLALAEFHSEALSNMNPSETELEYPLGYASADRKGFYRQLVWTANRLNNSYYARRGMRLLSIEYPDGREEHFDPWLNTASAALHDYFNHLLPQQEYHAAIGPDGMAKIYRGLFGDPWVDEQPHIPGSLEQPVFALPFKPGGRWAYTGGPHAGWGSGEPLAALDFAPPSSNRGCVPTSLFTTAVAPGVVARIGEGELVLDLDGDGDERTGWALFYLHVAAEGGAPLGTQLNTGDKVGHPSCEGGTSTGTHVHIARKYNGEWMPAEGLGNSILAFNLEGWIASNGTRPYLGYLTRQTTTVVACECSNAASQIASEQP